MSAISVTTNPDNKEIPEFCHGIEYFGQEWPGAGSMADAPVIADGDMAVKDASDIKVAYQTLMMADALRYLTLQVTGAKGSGHPGGFASSAEAYASLVILVHGALPRSQY